MSAAAINIETILDNLEIPKGTARNMTRKYLIELVQQCGECIEQETVGYLAAAFYDGYLANESKADTEALTRV
jgi:hypothetical protein